MDVREKLLELYRAARSNYFWVDRYQEAIVDELIANGVTVQEWISVKDRLPDQEFWEHQNRFEGEDFEVQVMIKGARYTTTLLYDAEGEFYEQHSDGQTFYIVTHWAPLMEPPKGE